MKFTDSHCHLDFNEFRQQMPELLSQCLAENIHQVIIPAVNPEHWQRVLSLSNGTFSKTTENTNVNIYASLGIHPWFVASKDTLQQKDTCFDHNSQLLADAVKTNYQKIVAIGECGIDVTKARESANINEEYSVDKNIALQQQYFNFHLHLANEYNLPVIIHHRQSHHLIIPILKRHNLNKGGVIHAFSGSYQQAKQYIDLGFKLGVGGTITYPRAKKTIEAIQKAPLSSLVIETDAPSMPLFGHQGEINSPLMLIEVFKQLCLIRKEPKEIIAKQLELNIGSILQREGR